MKKFFLSAMALVAAMTASAQCAYVLYNAADISKIQGEQAKVEIEGEQVTTDEDPEIVAARFFRDNYELDDKGMFIQVSEIANLKVEEIPVLWINVDRMGFNLDQFDALFNEDVINAIKAYSAKGGKLYLTKQASRILYKMGRCGYAPGYGDGGYHQGGDIWAINPILGGYPHFGEPQFPTLFDNHEHPFFADMDTVGCLVDSVHYNYGMVGPVARTDNNNMWVDLFRKAPAGLEAKWQFNGTDADLEDVPADYCHYENWRGERLTDFMSDWNCTPLAAWGQVIDMCGMGIIDWHKEGNIDRIVTNGFAAYQWGKSNDHIDNIKLLTKNILSELGADHEMAVENIKADKVRATKTIKNGHVVILKNGVEYNVLGATL